MPTTKRTFKTSTNLDSDVRKQMIEVLNQSLADSLDLYSQSKQAHWNVKGMNFFALHQLFDQVAEGTLPMVDEIGERVTALGGEAMGTVRMSATNSTLPEFPTDIDTGESFVNAIVERVSAFANSSRENANKAMDAGDEATADLFIEITRETDKMLYFLEAHIQ